MNKDYYIFKSGRMRRKNNTFYFIDEEENKRSLPIQQMEDIHVFGKVDFNTDFLDMLTKHDVRIHFYNYYGFYNGTYYPRRPVRNYIFHPSKMRTKPRIFLGFP